MEAVEALPISCLMSPTALLSVAQGLTGGYRNAFHLPRWLEKDLYIWIPVKITARQECTGSGFTIDHSRQGLCTNSMATWAKLRLPL